MNKNLLINNFFLILGIMFLASGVYAHPCNMEKYPICQNLTDQLAVRRAALAITTGYNLHIQDLAAKNPTDKTQEMAKMLSSLTSAGILEVPFRYPKNAQEKAVREKLLALSFYFTKRQTDWKNVRPDAAFCTLQHMLYLYPITKFQHNEINEERQKKLLYYTMHVCPGRLTKVR